MNFQQHWNRRNRVRVAPPSLSVCVCDVLSTDTDTASTVSLRHLDPPSQGVHQLKLQAQRRQAVSKSIAQQLVTACRTNLNFGVEIPPDGSTHTQDHSHNHTDGRGGGGQSRGLNTQPIAITTASELVSMDGHSTSYPSSVGSSSANSSLSSVSAVLGRTPPMSSPDYMHHHHSGTSSNSGSLSSVRRGRAAGAMRPRHISNNSTPSGHSIGSRRVHKLGGGKRFLEQQAFVAALEMLPWALVSQQSRVELWKLHTSSDSQERRSRCVDAYFCDCVWCMSLVTCFSQGKVFVKPPQYQMVDWQNKINCHAGGFRCTGWLSIPS